MITPQQVQEDNLLARQKELQILEDKKADVEFKVDTLLRNRLTQGVARFSWYEVANVLHPHGHSFDHIGTNDVLTFLQGIYGEHYVVSLDRDWGTGFLHGFTFQTLATTEEQKKRDRELIYVAIALLALAGIIGIIAMLCA